MAKLIFSLEGGFIAEYPINKERLTIGRRPESDIHIDNLAVSGNHATILTIGKDSFLEDNHSTNGTKVNGLAVTKRVLQHNDVIGFGKFELRYYNESALNVGKSFKPNIQFERTMLVSPASSPRQKSKFDTTVMTGHSQGDNHRSIHAEAGDRKASIRVLNGASPSKELVLTKVMTTLGKTGEQVAVITKRTDYYFITHLEGKSFPKVNENPIGIRPMMLKNLDIIELSGIKMQFSLTNQ